MELVDATLIVNGKDITAGHYVKINKTYRYAEVPFLAVLEALGAKIEQIDEINVKITIYNDKENLSDANIKDIYILDTQNVFLAHGKYTENEDGSFTFDNNYMYEKDYAQKQPINFFYILCGQCPPFFHAVINGEFISDTLSAKYVIRTLSHDFFIDYNNNTVSVETIN